eukprot:364146-Chlamydomonas_euryale.AAC.2
MPLLSPATADVRAAATFRHPRSALRALPSVARFGHSIPFGCTTFDAQLALLGMQGWQGRHHTGRTACTTFDAQLARQPSSLTSVRAARLSLSATPPSPHQPPPHPDHATWPASPATSHPPFDPALLTPISPGLLNSISPPSNFSTLSPSDFSTLSPLES